MIDKSPMRFGLVGAGAIARAYGDAFQQSRVANLVAVADVSEDARNAYSRQFGCPPYATPREMLEQDTVEAVIVCTPPITHPGICTDIMRCGVSVLCEKPLAIDSVSARNMVSCANRCHVTFTMASKFRYVPDVARAKSLVMSGVIGDVVLFENAFTGHVDMSDRWNSNPKISGGGVLIDNGTHSVDIMRYFLGPLADLQVVEGKRPQGLAVEETVRMFVRAKSGVMGSVDLSWSINKGLPTFISIYGSDGTLTIGWQESKYRRSNDTDWTVFGSGYNKTEAFRNQIDNFARSIRGDEALVITPADAVASVETIEAAYSALHRSQWEPVRRTGAGGGIGDPDQVVYCAGMVT